MHPATCTCCTASSISAAIWREPRCTCGKVRDTASKSRAALASISGSPPRKVSTASSGLPSTTIWVLRPSLCPTAPLGSLMPPGPPVLGPLMPVPPGSPAPVASPDPFALLRLPGPCAPLAPPRPALGIWPADQPCPSASPRFRAAKACSRRAVAAVQSW